jgi:ketosteroid isomerase-like protein
MDAEKSKAIVKAWFDKLATGDATGAFELFAPDTVYVLQGTTPVSGTYRGLPAILGDFFAPWRMRIDGDLTLALDELIGEGERVVALARGSAKTVTGARYDNQYCFVFTVRGGRITEVNEFLDTVLVETAAYGRKLV